MYYNKEENKIFLKITKPCESLVQVVEKRET